MRGGKMYFCSIYIRRFINTSSFSVLFLLFLANLISFMATADGVNKTEEISKATILKDNQTEPTPSLDENVAVTKIEDLEGSGSDVKGKDQGVKRSGEELTDFKGEKKTKNDREDEKDLNSNNIKPGVENLKGEETTATNISANGDEKVMGNSVIEDGNKLEGAENDLKTTNIRGNGEEPKVMENSVKEDEKEVERTEIGIKAESNMEGKRKDLSDTENKVIGAEINVKEKVGFKGDVKDNNTFPVEENQVNGTEESLAKEEFPTKEELPIKEQSPVKEEVKETDTQKDLRDLLHNKYYFNPKLDSHTEESFEIPDTSSSDTLHQSEEASPLAAPAQEGIPFSQKDMDLSPLKNQRRKTFALDPPSEEWRGSKYDLFSKENYPSRHFNHDEFHSPDPYDPELRFQRTEVPSRVSIPVAEPYNPDLSYQRPPPIPISEPYEEDLTHPETWKRAPRLRYPVPGDQQDWQSRDKPMYPIQSEPNQWHQNQKYWHERQKYDMLPQSRQRPPQPMMEEQPTMQYQPQPQHIPTYDATFQVSQHERPRTTAQQILQIGQQRPMPMYAAYPGFVQQNPMAYNQDVKRVSYDSLNELVNPELMNTYNQAGERGAWRYNMRSL